MSYIEVKTWQFTCDRCGVKVLVSAPFFEKPKGWTTEEVHGCGSTGYTKTIDICVTCSTGADDTSQGQAVRHLRHGSRPV